MLINWGWMVTFWVTDITLLGEKWSLLGVHCHFRLAYVHYIKSEEKKTSWQCQYFDGAYFWNTSLRIFCFKAGWTFATNPWCKLRQCPLDEQMPVAVYYLQPCQFFLLFAGMAISYNVPWCIVLLIFPVLCFHVLHCCGDMLSSKAFPKWLCHAFTCHRKQHLRYDCTTR